MNTLSPITRPDWLPFERWPFDTSALTTPAGQIAVTDVGSGPTLLFVHVGSWSFIWRDLLLELSPHYRCITIDPPGSGLSSHPDSPISLRGAAEAVGAVIDALDLRGIAVIMHDAGGPVGLVAAAQRPERIAGLVALNALGWRPTGVALRGMLALAGSAPARESIGRFGGVARVSASSFGAGKHWTRTDRRIFLAGLDRSAQRNTHRYLNALRRETDTVGRAEAALHHELARLPLLTVFGSRNDPFRLARRWKQLFPDAEQHVIAGGNHYPMGDDPTAAAEWIRRWHTERVLPAPNVAPIRPPTTEFGS
jgi:pimeloyl-ACP methyl ester carboxylesterase